LIPGVPPLFPAVSLLLRTYKWHKRPGCNREGDSVDFAATCRIPTLSSRANSWPAMNQLARHLGILRGAFPTRRS